MDMNNIPLKIIETKGHDRGSNSSNEREAAGNGRGVDRTSGAMETEKLLVAQGNGGNGETFSPHALEVQKELEKKYSDEESATYRIRREMNEIVFGNVRLWMVIIAVLVLFVAAIVIALAVCSAIHEDEDEKYDSSLFKVALNFNGSFQLPNMAYTEELFTLYSNESQAIAFDLQEKLADLYSASPALGRYFFKAEIYALRNRNGSVMADYELTFRMPEDQQDQLRKFTLSREMVYNVLRQYLYDQEPDLTLPQYIDPFSLIMT